MEEEILACIKYENIKYLQSGHISKYIFPKKRKEAHLKKIPHITTRLFIISKNPKGELFFLVQKRGNKKESFPGFFTDSSSGHVIWSKNLTLNEIKKNAIRELEEEFGIPLKSIQKIILHDLWIEEDELWIEEVEMVYVFFGIIDYNTHLEPDPKELDVKESKFYSRTELESILENEKNTKITKKIWKKLIDMDIDFLFKEKNGQIESKKKEIALFIGRFQPLHHGHIYVLNNILKSYKKVKIGIGSSQLSNSIYDPFTSEERKKFLKAALDKRRISPKLYEIYKIPDIFSAKKWVDHVISIVGKFNSIFSNSHWVRELFLNKEIKVEKKITIFKKKFNGNYIRNLILRNNKKWKTLVPKEVVELIEEFNGINRIKNFE